MTTQSTIVFIIALLTVALIPLAPKLLRVRIRFLRWLHLDWFANLHENHFRTWVIIIRVTLAIVALLLFWAAFAC